MSDSHRGAVADTTHQAPPHSHQAAASAEAVSLVIVHSPDEQLVGTRWALTEDALVVGRDVDAPGTRVNDMQLSRVHFRIVHDGRSRRHRVGDAQSRNGTFVDGVRVRSSLLDAGAVVRAGETVFVYEAAWSMDKVSERVSRVAPSDLAVLVLGETGSGKERIARSVHELSGRKGAFVAINCGALPRELAASELFGHTRGAFSGAATPRLGLLQAADEGTLFLDEIGDLPIDLQAVLLRTLQERTVRPIGSDAEIRVDVRIVAATHQSLEDAIEHDGFRLDLYSRLAQAVVRIPPLRERRADILGIAGEVAASSRRRLTLTADSAEALVRYEWRSNVRELESLVRAFVVTEGESPMNLSYLALHHPQIVDGFRRIEQPDTPTRRGSASARAAEPRTRRDRAAMEELLLRHGGNVSAACEELGKPRALVYRWLHAAGLDPERFRRHQ